MEAKQENLLREQVPDDTELHVDFEHLSYIDHACLDLLMSWAKGHEATGGTLVIDWESLHANFHGDPRSLVPMPQTGHRDTDQRNVA